MRDKLIYILKVTKTIQLILIECFAEREYIRYVGRGMEWVKKYNKNKNPTSKITKQTKKVLISFVFFPYIYLSNQILSLEDLWEVKRKQNDTRYFIPIAMISIDLVFFFLLLFLYYSFIIKIRVGGDVFLFLSGEQQQQQSKCSF